MNYKTEKAVRAFLTGKVTATPKGSILSQGMAAVNVATYDCVREEFTLPSDVVTATALCGVSARAVLNKLLGMVHVIDDMEIPAAIVCVNAENPRSIYEPVISTVEAVYHAVELVCRERVLRDYAALKSKAKRNAKPRKVTK